MEIPIILTLVFTFLSPFITAFLNRVQWSTETKTLMAMAVSLVIAVLYLIMTGGIADWSQLAVVGPMVFTLQQVVYKFFVKGPANELEIATTSTKSLMALGDHHPDKPAELIAPAAEPAADIFEPIYSGTPAKG